MQFKLVAMLLALVCCIVWADAAAIKRLEDSGMQAGKTLSTPTATPAPQARDSGHDNVDLSGIDQALAAKKKVKVKTKTEHDTTTTVTSTVTSTGTSGLPSTTSSFTTTYTTTYTSIVGSGSANMNTASLYTVGVLALSTIWVIF